MAYPNNKSKLKKFKLNLTSIWPHIHLQSQLFLLGTFHISPNFQYLFAYEKPKCLSDPKLHKLLPNLPKVSYFFLNVEIKGFPRSFQSLHEQSYLPLIIALLRILSVSLLFFLEYFLKISQKISFTHKSAQLAAVDVAII